MSKSSSSDLLLLTASDLDAADELARFRGRFALPTPVYLCGHSLGPQPDTGREAVMRHLDKWAEEGVEGHFQGFEPWSTVEDTAIEAGCELVGAELGEIVLMNSLTVNLHLMLMAFYDPHVNDGRVEVIIEEKAFPSDDYALQTHLDARGVDSSKSIVRLRPRAGEQLLREDDIYREITTRAQKNTLALVLLPGVQFYTGQVLPISEISSLCQKLGVAVGFDLAHAIGNIPLDLHAWGLDFAVWCTYKYLNGGPGAIGGAFMHAKHRHRKSLRRLGGWWGHDRDSRFKMDSKFIPQPGVYGFQISNPPVLALAPVAASLQIFREAGGIHALRSKSIVLTAFLERMLLQKLRDEIEIITPSQPEKRGCQLSIRLRNKYLRAKTVQESLRAAGIQVDFREPDVLRVAPIPLYNSFTDVDKFVTALDRIMRKMPQ
jgi:kynureninase